MPLLSGYIPIQIAGEIDGTLKDTDACVPVKANLAGLTDGQTLVYNAALNALVAGNLPGGALGSPLAYIAHLSQGGASAPTAAAVLLDTITGITFSRFGAGIYNVTKAGAWLVGKVDQRITVNRTAAEFSGGAYFTFHRGSNNDLIITTNLLTAGAWVPTDGLLSTTPIQILLYP